MVTQSVKSEEKDCFNDFSSILFEDDFEAIAPVICPIIESTGRPGPDLLKGNTIFKGARQTCESFRDINIEMGNFSLKMFRATVNPGNGTECYSRASMDWEFCFLDSCSPEDIRQLLDGFAPEVGEKVCDIVKYDQYSFGFSWGTVILFTSTRSYKSASLNLLVTVSFIWLVFGEMGNYYTIYGRNALDIQSSTNSIFSQAQTMFLITLETFVFIIAVKIGSYYSKHFVYNNVRLENDMSSRYTVVFMASKFVLSYIMAYYLIATVYSVVIYDYLLSEMPLLYRSLASEGCSNSWVNYLFISNFYGTCLPNTFIVPVIVQLSLVLVPMFVIFNKFSKPLTVVVILILLVTSMITRGMLVHSYDLPPTYIIGYDVLDKEKFDFYRTYIHMLPWNYIAPFGVGLLVGSCADCPKLKIFKNGAFPFNLLPLILVPSLILLLALSVNRFYLENELMEQPYRALFSAGMPIIWSIALASYSLLFNFKSTLARAFVNRSGWLRVAQVVPIAVVIKELVYPLIVGYSLPLFEFVSFGQMSILLGIPALTLTLLVSTALHIVLVMPLQQVFDAIFVVPESYGT
ncbi:unnamed protein product [Bursaphelenchus okinawaensis]|uniref:Uncharacterized protein n=1 Tax=Bursaphelenchus okinawaensis TaxID=465554 RepID=A0A811K646_9BILA|nr:unnamed protein product [Bursaphelenchus okinawaensis]CAG9092272.1 unnamed protein product [Bursaphelenchus okinawaensis]